MTIDKPTSDALHRALLRSTTLVDEGRMEIDRSELRRLCEAATPGPWAYEDGSIVNREHEGDDWDIAEVYPQNRANAHLIAAARTALPTLIDALDEAEAMVSALNGDVTELGQRLEAAEERERGLRKALTTIKTAAGNVVWNAGRGMRAAGPGYDRCWEHVASIATAALAETVP